jgi:hypothetical protein
MSVTRKQQTNIKDKACLVEALRDLKFNPTVQEPAAIRMHASEMSKDKCEIVLRKEDTGRKADIGFAKQKDGTYSIVTDTWVNSDLANLEKFEAQVKVPYVKRLARKTAAKNGIVYKTTKQLPNGKTRMVFTVA